MVVQRVYHVPRQVHLDDSSCVRDSGDATAELVSAERHADAGSTDTIARGAVACFDLLRAHEPTYAAAARATIELAAEHAAHVRGLGPDATRALLDALSPREPGVRGRARTRTPELFAAAARPRIALDVLAQPGALGDVYEALLAARAPDARRARGSWFTPGPVARRLVDAAFDARAGLGAPPVRVVFDPAMGAGRLLLSALAHAPASAMHGIDRDPLAVFVARIELALAAGCTPPEAAALVKRFRVGDALAPGALGTLRADVVVGNPPWVAHAGRQTVKLDEHVRLDFRTRFESFSGFPTTHCMFVELAARALAPSGVLALLLPTQVADLAGYGPARAALSRTARVLGPLDELGFGQFAGVTEPTLVLRAVQAPEGPPDPSPWPVRESLAPSRRERPSDRALAALARLRERPRFDPATFGEAGFQTAGALTKTHLAAYCATTPARFSVALREGRDVEAFCALAPSRALDPDPASLAKARTRLREPAAYARVAVLIRQTARYPIAALNAPPFAFRNSLLAAYSETPHALCALLNSALLRSYHLATQRDGRQAVFPQLKVAHLRALPAPPAGQALDALDALARVAAEAQRARFNALGEFATRSGLGRVPRGLFALDAGEVPARAERVHGERAQAAYARALDEVRAASRRYRDAVRAIDDAVYAMYGVAEDERAGLGEGG